MAVEAGLLMPASTTACRALTGTLLLRSRASTSCRHGRSRLSSKDTTVCIASARCQQLCNRNISNYHNYQDHEHHQKDNIIHKYEHQHRQRNMCNTGTANKRSSSNSVSVRSVPVASGGLEGLGNSLLGTSVKQSKAGIDRLIEAWSSG